jgi:hypothetical protein
VNSKWIYFFYNYWIYVLTFSIISFPCVALKWSWKLLFAPPSKNIFKILIKNSRVTENYSVLEFSWILKIPKN